jgi:hypothetical protein
MSRKSIVVVESDLSGEPIQDKGEWVVVSIRFESDPEKDVYELDAKAGEVQNLMDVARTRKRKGPLPTKK